VGESGSDWDSGPNAINSTVELSGGRGTVPNPKNNGLGRRSQSWSMLLTGSYRRNLDDKLRLSIPKVMREALDFPDQRDLYIAPGQDQSLAIYPPNVLEEIGRALSRSSPAAKQTRNFSRLFYAQAQRAEIDRQGRLRIPPELAQLASLKEEVVVLGVRDRIELWGAAAWDSFLADTQSSYDELAEQVFAEHNPKTD